METKKEEPKKENKPACKMCGAPSRWRVRAPGPVGYYYYCDKCKEALTMEDR